MNLATAESMFGPAANWTEFYGPAVDAQLAAEIAARDSFGPVIQWAPGLPSLTTGPGQQGGDSMNANAERWIQRGAWRIAEVSGRLQLNNGSTWADAPATGFYDPHGAGTNERLQLLFGFKFAPAAIPIEQFRAWALANGWKEPSRSDGVTLGEALLYMGGAAFVAGSLAGSGAFGAQASAADLAAADAAAGLVPDFGTIATIETTTTGANTVSLSLEDSVGNFGDWIGTDSGTMYNPQTGEYLTPDGYYDAGSLGNIAPGGADAYYSSAASFANSGASLSTSLNDIFGKVSQVLKSAGAALSGAQQITANNKVQPNLNRNIGQTNLALPLLAAAAWFAFKG